MELLLIILLATAHLADVEVGDEEVLGVVGTRIVKRGETLIEMAREHGVASTPSPQPTPGSIPSSPSPAPP